MVFDQEMRGEVNELELSVSKFSSTGLVLIKKVLKAFEFSAVPQSQTYDFQWRETLEFFKIDLAIDVGANTGQFFMRYRDAGFRGPVHSFEPDPRALSELNNSHSLRDDPEWIIHPFALGDVESEAEFYQWSVEGGSSSLKRISEEGQDFTRVHQASLETISVPVRKLEGVLAASDLDDKNALLKIDVQGFEIEVLRGIGSDLLKRFAVIDIEIPLYGVYQDGGNFVEIFSLLTDSGFVPYSIQSERWRGGGYGVADCDVLLVHKSKIR